MWCKPEVTVYAISLMEQASTLCVSQIISVGVFCNTNQYLVSHQDVVRGAGIFAPTVSPGVYHCRPTYFKPIDQLHYCFGHTANE